MHNFMPMPISTQEEENTPFFMNHLQQNMQEFWRERLTEIIEAPSDVRSQLALPLTRIKKVMKSDEQVKMISADTPVLFAKACEIFIMELTLRAWMHTHENKRRTLQRNDVANAIRDEDLLFFLNDIVPMEINQGVALGGHQVATDDNLAFPYDLQYTRVPSFFTRLQEMFGNTTFPSPSTPDNVDNS